ncbi:hypothetical protein SAMN04488564_104710 [Lentzea waywayandensis]|uniref:Uncharacterized protein n=1 Tax=Lentzea waywayandensis TaxID=84724 RepID=A0A1I6EK04_9PSEU|nr:hypothetical protein SAMN04488564_104710 [Lentzea waywayandensis]
MSTEIRADGMRQDDEPGAEDDSGCTVGFGVRTA